MLGQSLAVLCLSALTAATPLAQRRTTANSPLTSTAQAAVLIVNVTDPLGDLNPPVDGWALTPFHSGAGMNYAVLQPLSAESNPGAIFYLNGTLDQVLLGQGTLINDEGSPSIPFGLLIMDSTQTAAPLYPDAHLASVDAGPGTPARFAGLPPSPYPPSGFHLPALRNLLPGAEHGSFAVCNISLPYYQGSHYPVLDFVYAGDGETEPPVVLPEGCVAVTVLPQCAALGTLAPGSISSHEYVNDIPCYQDVASIEWSKYGSP